MLKGPNHALILHAAKGMFIQNAPVTDDEGKQLVRLEPWAQWSAWNNSALPEMRHNSNKLKCLQIIKRGWLPCPQIYAPGHGQKLHNRGGNAPYRKEKCNINQLNKFIFFKNLPILDERRPKKTAVRSGTLQLDKFSYSWLDMYNFFFLKEGQFYVSVKRMFEDIQWNHPYSVTSIKERWFKQNLKLETPVRAKRRVPDTIQIIEQTNFDSLWQPRLN